MTTTGCGVLLKDSMQLVRFNYWISEYFDTPAPSQVVLARASVVLRTAYLWLARNERLPPYRKSQALCDPQQHNTFQFLLHSFIPCQPEVRQFETASFFFHYPYITPIYTLLSLCNPYLIPTIPVVSIFFSIIPI